MNSRDRFLAALHRQPHDRAPVWIMRQAGRYLPEYRALKAKSDFVTMVRTPELAVEVTLQPLRRFPQLDAAILFSDILVIPEALGVGYRFRDEGGIAMERALASPADVATLKLEGSADRLQYVYDALAILRKELGLNKTLLGFAGSPWTLACYLVEGGGSEDFPKTKALIKADPKMMHRILEILTDAVAQYLTRQFAAGADAIQIFDSWASGLPPALFAQVVIAPTKKIVAAVRAARPGARIIGFPRAATLAGYEAYVQATGVDAVSLDTSAPMRWAAKNLGCAIQGNLDPIALIAGGAALDRAVDDILQATAGKPHVFNLGHGILPETPIAHVEQLLKRIRQ